MENNEEEKEIEKNKEEEDLEINKKEKDIKKRNKKEENKKEGYTYDEYSDSNIFSKFFFFLVLYILFLLHKLNF